MTFKSWLSVFTLSVLNIPNIYTMRWHYNHDPHLCNYTHWELVEQEHFVTKKVHGVLNRDEGGRHETLTEVVIEKGGKYYVNTSKVVEDCCVGYEKRRWRDKCRPCRYQTVGRNCLRSCQCRGCRGCDHRTEECNKCKHLPGGLTTSTTKVNTLSATSISSITTKVKPDVTQQEKTDGDDDDNSTTILLAVIFSVETLTIILVFVYLLRKRNHKRRNSTDNYEIPGRQLYDQLFFVSDQAMNLNLNVTATESKIEDGGQGENQYENEATEINDENEYLYIV